MFNGLFRAQPGNILIPRLGHSRLQRQQPFDRFTVAQIVERLGMECIECYSCYNGLSHSQVFQVMLAARLMASWVSYGFDLTGLPPR